MEEKQNQSLSKRRGIVYIYGFEWCNPNGDPSFDNEPRIYGGKLFVSDVFLKRRIRDYVDLCLDKKEGNEIFLKEIIKEDGTRETPEERVKEILENSDENISEVKKKLLQKCWDLRVFGFLIPIPGKEGEEEGTSIKSIGPVQISFGVSLNNVENPLDVAITNVMASKEEKKRGGTIGRKYVVPVALVEHYIFVNEITAKQTGMTENDYNILIEALKNLKITPTLMTSSKNSTPIMIVEIEFKDNGYANLFGLTKAESTKEEPTSIYDYKIDVSKLFEKIDELKNKNIIEKVKVLVKKEYLEKITNLPATIEKEEF